MALTMSMLLFGIGPAQASDDDNGGGTLGILGILGGHDGDDGDDGDYDDDDDDDDDDGNDCFLGILCIFNG
ncbi:MAG: hypothetical protein ACRDZ4_01315 [Egibacteraceae bacterium]